MSNMTLLIAFGIIFILEYGAFLMQRATLLMSREAGVPPKIGALLLPRWFVVVWLVRLGKWSILFYIAFTWSWLVAGGLLAANIILVVILPKPYSVYVSVFRGRIEEIKTIDFEAGVALEEMLNSSQINNS